MSSQAFRQLGLLSKCYVVAHLVVTSPICEHELIGKLKGLAVVMRGRSPSAIYALAIYSRPVLCMLCRTCHGVPFAVTLSCSNQARVERRQRWTLAGRHSLSR